MIDVTRKSITTGIIRTKKLNVTEQQMKEWINGKLAQHAFPQLNADDREFIISGMTTEEWDEYAKY